MQVKECWVAEWRQRDMTNIQRNSRSRPNIFTMGSLLAMRFGALVGTRTGHISSPETFLIRSPEIQQHLKNSGHAHKANAKMGGAQNNVNKYLVKF